ncbi:MAG: recombinase family protein, partial [SAR202 cluster bacterium]|nr:recombinase family protein [SAR202 cluster bacterium]
ARRWDVLVVHKLDRFARNARITLEYLEKLEKAGVGFISITEQMDFSTPIGKVMLANLAASANITATICPLKSKRA